MDVSRRSLVGGYGRATHLPPCWLLAAPPGLQFGLPGRLERRSAAQQHAKVRLTYQTRHAARSDHRNRSIQPTSGQRGVSEDPQQFRAAFRHEDSSVQISLLLLASVGLLIIPWASSHPAILLAPLLLAITPVVGSGVRLLLREAAVTLLQAVTVSVGLLPRPAPPSHVEPRHQLREDHMHHVGHHSPSPQQHPMGSHTYLHQQPPANSPVCSRPSMSQRRQQQLPSAAGFAAAKGPHSEWPRQRQKQHGAAAGALAASIPTTTTTSSSSTVAAASSSQHAAHVPPSAVAAAVSPGFKPGSPRGSPASSMDGGSLEDQPLTSSQPRRQLQPSPQQQQQPEAPLDYHEFLGLEHPQQLQQLQQQADYHEFMEHHVKDPRVLSRREKEQLHQHHQQLARLQQVDTQ